jgi:putative ABC transport system permease protein
MLAFGLPGRTVLGVNTVESVLTGLAGTLLGVGTGYLVAAWTVQTGFEATMPEIQVVPYVSVWTVATAVALGVVAVALAPVLSFRRITRMEISSTLRVLE